MPLEAPALDASLAPAQIYIVLAITVATFGWLLRPETLRQLTGLQVIAGGLLILYQCMHLWVYVTFHAIQPAINTVLHGVALALYLLTAAWLLKTRWIEARDHPPTNPADE